MNGLTLLIIGAPAVLLALAGWMQRKSPEEIEYIDPPEYVPAFQWPSREWARSETEER